MVATEPIIPSPGASVEARATIIWIAPAGTQADEVLDVLEFARG